MVGDGEEVGRESEHRSKGVGERREGEEGEGSEEGEGREEEEEEEGEEREEHV